MKSLSSVYASGRRAGWWHVDNLRGDYRRELVACCADLVAMNEREFIELFYFSEPEDIAFLLPGVNTDTFFSDCKLGKADDSVKRAYLLGWVNGIAYHNSAIIRGRLNKKPVAKMFLRA